MFTGCGVVRVQERYGNSHSSFVFDLTDREFWLGVRERARPGSTMVCGSFGYGDALMTTPALRGLKELLPRNPVHVYCGPKEYSIFENNPHIDLLVAVPPTLVARSFRHTFARLCSLYDRHSLLCGIIRDNPEAEIVNAYELIAKKIGVQPSSLIPAYYPLSTEIERARQALEALGVSPARDRIAVFQPKASSLLRTLPDETIGNVLRRLEGGGWKTVVFWDNADRPQASSTFGCWTSRDFSNLTLRDLFAIVSFATIAITTDSVVCHLAAAFGIPSVVLYGPFSAELRSAHFPRAYPLQANVECAPCFKHGNRCPIEGVGIPSCMRSFSGESIMEAADAILNSSRRPDRKEAPIFNAAHCSIACRMCGCKEVIYYACKNKVLYVKCTRCGTAQIREPSNGDGLFSTPEHSYFERQDRVNLRGAGRALNLLLPTVRALVRNNSSKPLLLDFGTGNGRARKVFGQMDFVFESFEQCVPLAHTQSAPQIGSWTDLEHLAMARQAAYDVIMMLDSFQYLRQVDIVFPKIVSCLNKGRCLVLTLFSAEDIPCPSFSAVLAGRSFDHVLLIPSLVGLDVFMARFGLRRIWNSRIPAQKRSLFVYLKE